MHCIGVIIKWVRFGKNLMVECSLSNIIAYTAIQFCKNVSLWVNIFRKIEKITPNKKK